MFKSWPKKVKQNEFIDLLIMEVDKYQMNYKKERWSDFLHLSRDPQKSTPLNTDDFISKRKDKGKLQASESKQNIDSISAKD